MSESVYISSTYEDLKIFRQAVIDCVVSLVDYYVPVSMEYYNAEDLHFVEKCEGDVAKCKIYILILGKRYGYIPKGFKQSITELEYDKAVERQKKGDPIEILVFKVGEFCKNYKYEENDPMFTEYQQSFLDQVAERLSPKPFDSEAELKLQVSHALMKRLFKLIRSGNKVMLPDKDSVLCYCDRKPAITSLKMNVLIKQKRVFFLQANRMTDYPGGIVKRFAKYSLGSVSKIEPLLNITNLNASCETDTSYISIIYNILEYVNREATEENIELKGFVEDLALLKSRKLILPFYYDCNFDQNDKKFADFLCFLDLLYSEFEKQPRTYELYIIIMIYDSQPNFEAISAYLKKYPLLNKLGANIDKLTRVSKHDILDWMETFITGTEKSASIYNEYFSTDLATLDYNMQDVNVTLSEIFEDLENGNEKIKKFL